MDLLLVALAYLIGSINFPILAGRLRGWDIRERDLAGTSGVFRQLGAGWGGAVLVLEVGKGVLAALLAALGTQPWVLPLCALAVVVGHIWPLWFGFRGGGGLAAAGGFGLFAFPGPGLWGLLVFGVALGVYFLVFKRDRFQGLGSIPFAAIFAFAALLLLIRQDALAMWTVLALVAPMAFRGVLVLTGRWWHR